MEAALTVERSFYEEIERIMDELHEFVSTVQRPKLFDESWTTKMHETCLDIQTRIDELRASFEQKREAWSDSLDEIADTLRNYSKELSQETSTTRLQTLYQSLESNYEDLFQYLRGLSKDIAAWKPDSMQHLKPINYKRNLFHIGNGILAIITYEFIFGEFWSLIAVLCMLTLAVSLEVSRRFSDRWNDFLVNKVFGMVSRPFEMHKVNGSTYYLLGLAMILLLFPKHAVEAGVLVLTFADPAASMLGKQFGKKKLYRDKSRFGTSVFFTVATLAIFIFLAIARPDIAWLPALGIAGSVGLVGALTELFTVHLDDNFTVPVMCAAVASLFLV